MIQSISYEQQQILQSSIEVHDELYAILKACSTLEPICYVAAGAIRNIVWSYLHGYKETLVEIDVIYYDTDEKNQEIKQYIEEKLTQLFPHYTWDVVNQAQVHTWYRTDKGENIAPLMSISDALSLWPETATAVAVRLVDQDNLKMIAPFGLHDLIKLQLRWNPRLVSHAVFKHRIESKNFLKRWSKLVEVLPFPADYQFSDTEWLIDQHKTGESKINI